MSSRLAPGPRRLDRRLLGLADQHQIGFATVGAVSLAMRPAVFGDESRAVMPGQPLRERRFSDAFDTVQADRERIMITDRRRQIGPVVPRIGAHLLAGQSADPVPVGIEDASAERDEHSARMLGQPGTIVLAGEDVVDRLGMSPCDDAGPAFPEIRIVRRRLGHGLRLPFDPAIRKKPAHPVEPLLAGDRIVGQRAKQDRQLIDEGSCRLDERDVPRMWRHEFAQQEPAFHALALRRHSISPTIASTKNRP